MLRWSNCKFGVNTRSHTLCVSGGMWFFSLEAKDCIAWCVSVIGWRASWWLVFCSHGDCDRQVGHLIGWLPIARRRFLPREYIKKNYGVLISDCKARSYSFSKWLSFNRTSRLMFNAPLLWFRTSVVVYVPLLWFMYLCCGLCTSVGVYVPLLGFRTSVGVYVPLIWFMYLCCGLCTSVVV